MLSRESKSLNLVVPFGLNYYSDSPISFFRIMSLYAGKSRTQTIKGRHQQHFSASVTSEGTRVYAGIVSWYLSTFGGETNGKGAEFGSTI